MKKVLNGRWSEVGFLVIVILLAFALKFWFAQNNHFLFWFDQARDTIVSQEMIATHHLKIQGPSASGTQDTVFHGVIWYYFLAPLYFIFHGNPQGIVLVLGLLTSLAILPYYFLLKEFSGSKYVAGLACVLVAFSPDSVTNSTWLANPVIAYCFVPVFYFAVWRTFFKRQYSWLIIAAVILGVLQQSIIFLAYLWIVILLGYFFDWQRQKKNQIPLRVMITAFGAYLLVISTMILTQLKLLMSGIFPMLTAHGDLMDPNGFAMVQGIVNLYFEKMRWLVLPQFPAFSVVVVIVAMIVTWKSMNQPKRYFLALWLLAPLSLLFFQYRNAIHIILGTEWLLIFCLVFAIFELSRKLALKYVFAVAIAVVLIGQVATLHMLHKTEESFVGTQQGAWLDQQLAMIDKTYSLANGEKFSISTFTNPYGYNTTWAYLYSWYGKEKYGYEPVFYGPDQTGIFGGDLMVRSLSPLRKHFVIVEPINGIPQYIYDQYMANQNANTATPSATYQFGTILLQQRFTPAAPTAVKLKK